MWIAAEVNEYRLITRADYEYANQAQKEKLTDYFIILFCNRLHNLF